MSIAVEEQFYILFGLSMFFYQKNLNWIPAIMFLTFFGFKLFFTNYSPSNLINNFPYFACGIIAAIFWQKNKSKLPQFFKSKIIAFLFFITTIYIAFFCSYLYEFTIYNNYLEPFVLSLFFASTLILFSACVFNKNYITLLLNFSGKITYGLYIWHGFVLTICYKLVGTYLPKGNPYNILILINFPITFLIAIASYYLLEKPFLKLKKNFR